MKKQRELAGAYARGLYHACGVEDAEHSSLIGIANSTNDLVPGHIHLSQVSSGDKEGQILWAGISLKMRPNAWRKDPLRFPGLPDTLHFGGHICKWKRRAVERCHRFHGKDEGLGRAVQHLRSGIEDPLLEHLGGLDNGAAYPVGTARSPLNAAIRRKGGIGVHHVEAVPCQVQCLSRQLGHDRGRALTIVRCGEENGDLTVQAQLGVGLARDPSGLAEPIPHPCQTHAPPPGGACPLSVLRLYPG